jgi:hypothetical protein
MALDPSLILGDDKVRSEAGHALVGRELLAPVCRLGARRHYLYHKTRVVFDERVLPFGTAGHHHVRVVDHVVRDAQLDALRIYPTRAAACGPPETTGDVADDPVVPLGSADHREDLAADVLVADSGRLFERQVLIDRKRIVRFDVLYHATSIAHVFDEPTT